MKPEIRVNGCLGSRQVTGGERGSAFVAGSHGGNKMKKLMFGAALAAAMTCAADISSQNICGYVNKDLSISDRSWICPNCGTEHNRDENAAMNLKNVALRIFTEGSSGSAELALNGNHL